MRTGGRREDEERCASGREPSAPRGGRKDGAHHFEVIFRRSTLPEAGTSQLSWLEKPATGMFSLPWLSPAAISWPAEAVISPQIGRASCRKACVSTGRSRWSPCL